MASCLNSFNGQLRNCWAVSSPDLSSFSHLSPPLHAPWFLTTSSYSPLPQYTIARGTEIPRGHGYFYFYLQLPSTELFLQTQQELDKSGWIKSTAVFLEFLTLSVIRYIINVMTLHYSYTKTVCPAIGQILKEHVLVKYSKEWLCLFYIWVTNIISHPIPIPMPTSASFSSSPSPMQILPKLSQINSENFMSAVYRLFHAILLHGILCYLISYINLYFLYQ